ncbi:ESX secretion-associated protein EspG [Nocardia sp. NPDC051052]|uniref:ESX secretion-associated protein EspG n=1 Tax=Nocardia sp. NPDC051052 TaxID=3364322 RepID=UPI00378E43D3
MTQQWEFTALEFIVLCERYLAGPPPVPFLFVSDEVVLVDELERRKQATWEDLRRRLDGSFDSVIEVLRTPELYVLASTWDEKDVLNTEKHLNLHAARSGALGYLFKQPPGKLTYDSPMVTITECHPHELVVAVVRALPKVEAGRQRDIPIVTDSPDQDESSQNFSFIRDDIEDRPTYRTEQFFQRTADCAGMIAVVQGRSRFGPRGIHETTLMWRDVADDGRYVWSREEAPIAVGTSRKQLVNRLQRDIDHLMERLETHWEWGRPEDRY